MHTDLISDHLAFRQHESATIEVELCAHCGKRTGDIGEVITTWIGPDRTIEEFLCSKCSMVEDYMDSVDAQYLDEYGSWYWLQGWGTRFILQSCAARKNGSADLDSRVDVSTTAFTAHELAVFISRLRCQGFPNLTVRNLVG